MLNTTTSKNGRSGHLFQNRFKSEVIETEKYFLMVLRKEFGKLWNKEINDECLDYNPTRRWMDDELAEYTN